MIYHVIPCLHGHTTVISIIISANKLIKQYLFDYIFYVEIENYIMKINFRFSIDSKY